jgi:hypothetical protein
MRRERELQKIVMQHANDREWRALRADSRSRAVSYDDDIFNDLLVAAGLAPIIASGITIWWLESLMEWRMEDPGFTIEQLRKLIAMRPIIRKIMRGPNPEKEIAAWAMRGGKAEVIQLDDFRTYRPRESRQGAAGF